MLELTSKNVEAVLFYCFFKSGEPTDNQVIVEGIVSTFGFHPERLKEKIFEIADLLSQLPKEFREDSGGGMSFLNACVREDGVHWGEHKNVEQLMVLGLAAGLVTYCLPQKVWPSLPGGVPYFVVNGISGGN